jgi:DNA-binding GntR family transcriptional regulator
MNAQLTPIGAQRSLQERTYQSMRLAILEGRYAPGERIYEAEVAQALGVSRNPVREAVRRLQQDGLLDVRAHYGIYVTRIPVEEIDDIYRIRAALEGTAAGFAAARMTDADVAELESIVQEQEQAVAAAEPLPRAPVSVVQADHFHHAIHVGANSPRLLAMLEQLYAQVTHFRNLTLRVPGRAAVSAAGHAEILKAIQVRDADTAENLMRAHIDDARQALLRRMDEIEKQSEAAPS